MAFFIDLGIEDLGPYRVYSRREVISLLSGIASQRQQVRMAFSQGGERSSTFIILIDEPGNSMLIDAGPDPMQNQRICGSDGIWFEALHQKIRILFYAERAEYLLHDGLPGFRIAIPDNLIRLQRREFHRVPVPVGSAVSCTFLPSATGAEPLMKPLVLPVRNISTGGAVIMDEAHLLDNTPGTVYRNCFLELSGIPVEVSLEVRNVQNLRLSSGKLVRHVGCRFVGVPDSILALVQRYIMKLERERNARTAGRL